MATMTDNDPAGSPQGEGEPAGSRPAEEPAEEPSYLTQTGEAVGEDGSVVPIIGGLPAAQGSAWNIGAPADERGAGLAEQLGHSEDREGEG
jgi:hypothetical protein